MAQGQLYKQVVRHSNTSTFPVVKIWAKVTCPADYDGGSAFTIEHDGGRIASVADGGTGIMTITLAETYGALIGYNAHVVNNDGLQYEPELQSEDVDGAKTITVIFRTVAGPATPTDPDAAVVYFEFTLLQDSEE